MISLMMWKPASMTHKRTMFVMFVRIDVRVLFEMRRYHNSEKDCEHSDAEYISLLICTCFPAPICVCVFVKKREKMVDSIFIKCSQSADLFLPPWVHASFDSIRDVNFQSKPSLTDLFPGGIALCTDRRERKKDSVDQLERRWMTVDRGKEKERQKRHVNDPVYVVRVSLFCHFEGWREKNHNNLCSDNCLNSIPV